MKFNASFNDSIMNQLTLRGFDKHLERRIRQIAKQEHVSLNKAALQLMRRGAGLDSDAPDPYMIGDALDDFIGSWSAGQAEAFDAATTVFEKIDAEQWQ
jgi:hypothetical protein